jgi:hypothetical protein
MKKTYLSPRTDVEHVLLEHNFTASPWYSKGGSGNFTYTVEEEDEFE